MSSRSSILVGAFILVEGADAIATGHLGAQAIVLPAKLGRFTLIQSDTVAGWQAHKYRGPQVVALDVFVRPAPDTSSEGVRRSIAEEVAKYEESLPLGVERGWYDTYEVAFADPKPVAVGDTVVPGHVVAVGVRLRSQVNLSLFYLYAVRGHLVKIRLTIPSRNWGANSALNFPEDLVRYLARRG